MIATFIVGIGLVLLGLVGLGIRFHYNIKNRIDNLENCGQDIWNQNSMIPGETFKSYATRQGIPDIYLDKVMYVYGILHPTGKFGWEHLNEPTEIFQTFLAENVREHLDLLGESWCDDQAKVWINKGNDDFTNAMLLKPDDWQYFVRTPKLWKTLYGCAEYIIDQIDGTYLSEENFQYAKYNGVLNQDKH